MLMTKQIFKLTLEHFQNFITLLLLAVKKTWQGFLAFFILLCF
jgi:hypothetical protein